MITITSILLNISLSKSIVKLIIIFRIVFFVLIMLRLLAPAPPFSSLLSPLSLLVSERSIAARKSSADVKLDTPCYWFGVVLVISQDDMLVDFILLSCCFGFVMWFVSLIADTKKLAQN